MAIVQGQFAFVGDIPQNAPGESVAHGFLENTTQATRGLVHAAIHHRIDGQGLLLYQARIGDAEDVRIYRRSLEGHFERQRWFRPVRRFINQGSVRRSAFIRTFRVVRDTGAKDIVLNKLINLVELALDRCQH